MREGLAAFFARALRRDFRDRFDNGEDMLRSWRAVFEQAAQAAPSVEPEDDIEALAARLGHASTVGELGYSPAALDVLSRMGINTVPELLGVDRIKFRYLQGVGDRIRREIRLKAKAFAQLRPDLALGGTSLHEQDEAELADCRWFGRDETVELIERGPVNGLSLPIEGTIARRLIVDWLEWKR